MSKLTDIEIIEELKKSLEEKSRALHDLRILTGKIEDLNMKLQESEAFKGNFLSNIRLEINNPLTSILVLSNYIASGTGLTPEKAASMAGIIYSDAFTLDFQLRNIFAAAEIESGEFALAVSNVNIGKIIPGVLESFRHMADNKHVTVSFNWASGPGEEHFFKTDPEKLRAIISNLLSNAIKFSSEGSVIVVKAWRREGTLNFVVEDSGIGIDEPDLQTIFERFRQLDRGITKNYPGQGLGLSVTKALVELLRGTISVASIRGKGSIFTVLIPEVETGKKVDVFSEKGGDFIFGDEEKF